MALKNLAKFSFTRVRLNFWGLEEKFHGLALNNKPARSFFFLNFL